MVTFQRVMVGIFNPREPPGSQSWLPLRIWSPASSNKYCNWGPCAQGRNEATASLPIRFKGKCEVQVPFRKGSHPPYTRLPYSGSASTLSPTGEHCGLRPRADARQAPGPRLTRRSAALCRRLESIGVMFEAALMHLHFSFVHFPNWLNIYRGMFLIWAQSSGKLDHVQQRANEDHPHTKGPYLSYGSRGLRPSWPATRRC